MWNEVVDIHVAGGQYRMARSAVLSQKTKRLKDQPVGPPRSGAGAPGTAGAGDDRGQPGAPGGCKNESEPGYVH